MTNQFKFVTPEQFEQIISVVERPVSPTDDGRLRSFAPWFGLTLRTIWATGARPSEIVGTCGRNGREEEEGLGPRVSRCRPLHGLRAADVQQHNRLELYGKHTSPLGRTDEPKHRTVLCANRALWAGLRSIATSAADPKANLFGLGVGNGPTDDGRFRLKCEIQKLQRRFRLTVTCPTCQAGPGAACFKTGLHSERRHPLQGFSPRWLRHGFAIAALRAGVDLVTIQRQLGHEDLSTTATYLRYAGLDDDRLINAFEHGNAHIEERDCPACGFAWRVDTKTGHMVLEDRAGLALRRRRTN